MPYADILVPLVAFAIIATASRQFGQLFQKLHLPLITGFLLTGLIAGPHVIGLITEDAVSRLRFIDQIALAFIAYAAGGELHLKELRSRLRSIAWITIGLVSCTFTISVIFLVMISETDVVARHLPFLAEMPLRSRIAVAILAGAILVARSPSSAIAVVNELRARGPFTRTALGVTVVMDVVVIVLFAINSSVADVLLTQEAFQPLLILLVVGEVLISIVIGFVLGRFVLLGIARAPIPAVIRIGLVLGSGWLVFHTSALIRHATHDSWSFEVLLEPLLICMTASFVLANRTSQRAAFEKIVRDSGPVVYIVFFTLAGASLDLGVVISAWSIALAIFFVRLVAIAIGTYLGGTIAGEPAHVNRLSWMAYVTQAGIGLGLAKEVAVEFQPWGPTLASLIVAVIVVNQLAGPPLFKWVLQILGEAHVRATPQSPRGNSVALIFGFDAQAIALARQLDAHGWDVVIATKAADDSLAIPRTGADLRPVRDYGLAELERIDARDATAIVSLLEDEESLAIAELAYEHFGTRNFVVQLHDRSRAEAFQELGCRIVEPETALVSLLDHFVRSPGAAALLLGMEPDQDAEDFVVTNADLSGVALRDLRFPLDTLVISVNRGGAPLISHGYTTLEVGDTVTVVGSPSSLIEIERKLQG